MMFVRIFIAVCAFAILFTVAFGQERFGQERFQQNTPQNNQQDNWQNPPAAMQYPVTPETTTPTQPANAPPQSPALQQSSNRQPPGQPPVQPTEQQVPAPQTAEDNYLPEDYLIPVPKENSVSFDVNQLSRTKADQATGLAAAFEQQSQATQSATNLLPQPAAGPTLPEGLWDNVSANFVLPAMNRLVKAAAQNQNPVVRPVLLSLLRHDVSVPTGLTELQWQARRAAWLLDLGHAMDAYNILQGLPIDALTQDAVLARTWTTSMLLAGDVSRACGFVRQQILNTRTSFWRQSLMSCQLLQQQSAALELSLRLLSPEERADQQNFLTLLQAVMDDVPPDVPVPDNQLLSPLAATIYGKHPGFLKYNMLSALPDVILQRIQTTQALPLPLRTHAAEILAAHYRHTPAMENLPQLYNAFSFDVLTAKDPIGSAKKAQNGTRARALLWQAAGMADLASLRATSLEALWQRARQDDLPGLERLLQPQSRNIKPRTALAWFAPAAIKATLRAGDVDLARAWWNSLQNNTMLSSEIVQARQSLAAVFQYLNADVDEDAFTTWWAEQPLTDPQVHQRLQQKLAVLDASGLQVPRQAWDELYARMNALQQPGPSHLWLRLLAQQLEQQQTGGVLLMLMEALHQPHMAPATIANVLTALSYLELPDVAQKVALHILLPHPPKAEEKPAPADQNQDNEPAPNQPAAASATRPAVSATTGLLTAEPAPNASGTKLD